MLNGFESRRDHQIAFLDEIKTFISFKKRMEKPRVTRFLLAVPVKRLLSMRSR